MTNKEKLMEKLGLTKEQFEPALVTDKDRLQALESAMLDLILGGEINV